MGLFLISVPGAQAGLPTATPRWPNVEVEQAVFVEPRGGYRGIGSVGSGPNALTEITFWGAMDTRSPGAGSHSAGCRLPHPPRGNASPSPRHPGLFVPAAGR